MRAKLIILILLLALPTRADTNKYLFVWINETMSASNVTKIANKLNVQLDVVTVFNWAEMPQWRSVANTNKIGKVLSLDITGKNLPFSKAQAETWCAANLGSETNKIQWLTGNTKLEKCTNLIEPIPIEDL